MEAGSTTQGEVYAAGNFRDPAASGLAMEGAESSLVDSAIRGDVAAFAALYDRHVDQVFRHCYFQSGNRADAEDLTQQTFLQAWQAIHRYRRGQAPFIAWLLTISQRLAVSKRRRAREVAGAVELPAPAQSDPEHAVMIGVEQDTVRQAILRLKGDRQAVILLRYVEGFSVSEAAAVLGKTENNVRVIQHRAVADLRQLIENPALPAPDHSNIIRKFRETVAALIWKATPR